MLSLRAPPPSAALDVASTSLTSVLHEYRDVTIYSDAGGTCFSFSLEGYPLEGWTGLGSIEAAMRLVDTWLDRPDTPAGSYY